jgi:hypothetical protein
VSSGEGTPTKKGEVALKRSQKKPMTNEKKEKKFRPLWTGELPTVEGSVVASESLSPVPTPTHQLKPSPLHKSRGLIEETKVASSFITFTAVEGVRMQHKIQELTDILARVQIELTEEQNVLKSSMMILQENYAKEKGIREQAQKHVSTLLAANTSKVADGYTFMLEHKVSDRE